MEIKGYVPIEVQGNRDYLWYLNVLNLDLSDLLKLRKELDRLNFLFQKGRIDWDYYNEEYGRIESELNDLQSALPEPVTNYGYLEELLDTDFRTMYDQLSQENRRAFWRSIIQEIHVNEDHAITSVDFL